MSSLLDQSALTDLADRLVAYVAPTLLGERGLPVIGFPGPDTLADATRWQLRGVTQLGADVRLTLEPPARERAAANGGAA